MIASLQNSVPLHATMPRCERRSANLQADGIEFFRQGLGVERRHIDDQQVLHVGGAQLAPGEALGEISGRLHLIGGNSTAQGNRSNVGKARLLLCMNADVIAVNIVRRMLFDRGIELESDAVSAVRPESGPPSIRDAGKETSDAHARGVRAERRSHGTVRRCP